MDFLYRLKTLAFSGGHLSGVFLAPLVIVYFIFKQRFYITLLMYLSSPPGFVSPLIVSMITTRAVLFIVLSKHRGTPINQFCNCILNDIV